MPRGVYLLGVGLALVALALAFTDRALSLRPGVTEANVQRIRQGMALAEVEALLGQPGGLVRCVWQPEPGVRAWRVWTAGDGFCLIGLDQRGRVLAIRALLPPRPDASSPFGRFRAWLGW